MIRGTAADCVLLVLALLTFSGCASFGIPSGPPPDKEAVQIRRDIKITRPPANASPIEVTETTYNTMLGKGYARIGTITFINYSFLCTETRVKKDLLEEAQHYGAEVAWLTTETRSTPIAYYAPARTYTTYDPGTPGYGNIRGTPATETTVSSGPSFGTKEYPYIYGIAILFVHEPELAASQLKVGKERWAKRAASIRTKRPTMIAKLSAIQDALRRCDVSLFNPSCAEYGAHSPVTHAIKFWCYYIEVTKTMVQSGYTSDYLFSLERETVSGELNEIYKATLVTGTLFKDPNSPQRSEINSLVKDATSYSLDNWDELSDFQTLKLPEPILFY